MKERLENSRYSLDLAKIFSAVFYGILALAFSALPLIILSLLNRGIDPSDAGYYYTSIANLEHISSQTTQFAVVWNLLPLPDSILWHRSVLWVFLLASGGYFLSSMWQLLWPHSLASKIKLMAILALGAAVTSVYYLHWTPDPSYNSMAYVLVLTMLGLFFQGLALLKQNITPRWHLFAAGMCAMALTLTRQPSALAMAVILSCVIALIVRPDRRMIGRIGAYVLCGVFTYVVLSSLFVELPGQTIERILGGLERREGLQRDYTHSDLFQLAVAGVHENLRQQGLWILLASLGAFGFHQEGGARALAKPLVQHVAKVLGIIGWSGLVYQFYRDSQVGTVLSLDPRADFILSAGLAVVFTAVLQFASYAVRRGLKHEIGAEEAHRTILLPCILLTLVLVQCSMFIGSSNSWLPMNAWFGTWVLAAMFVLASPNGEFMKSALSFVMLAALALMLRSTYVHMSEQPYRINGPLLAQTEATLLRDGRSQLRVDPETKLALDTLAAVDLGAMDERPILLDLSGRLPLITYHLGVKSPLSPWLLSGLKGSQFVFDSAVDKLDQTSFRAAWLLIPVDYEYAFNDEAIEKRGRNVLRDYREAARIYMPYIDSEVLLLRPNQLAQ